MKKSVALVIAAVFFASIVIVGFFGMRVVSYNEKIYISEGQQVKAGEMVAKLK